MKYIENDNDPLYGELVKDLKEKRTDLVYGGANTRNHFCSAKECSPRCNDSNVYLCKYGIVHVCSQTSCEYYAQTQSKTCPISGRVMETLLMAQNTYDKNDSRTWRKESEIVSALSASQVHSLGKKKHTRQTHFEHVLQHQSEDIVINLLYSSNRVKRNEVALTTMDEKAKKACQTYVNERFAKRQLPYLSDLIRITSSVFTHPLPYIIFEYNESLIQYYAAVIIQVWAIVIKYAVLHKDKVYETGTKIEVMPRIDFESVALAIMYAMREGMYFDNTAALPKDDFLFDNLPVLNDLDAYFSLSQNKVTKGTAILLLVYNNAKTDGATMEEICLNLSLLPLKDQKSTIRKLKM